MIGRRRSIHCKAGLVGWKSDGPLIDAILRKKNDAMGPNQSLSLGGPGLSQSGFWYRKRRHRAAPPDWRGRGPGGDGPERGVLGRGGGGKKRAKLPPPPPTTPTPTTPHPIPTRPA